MKKAILVFIMLCGFIIIVLFGNAFIQEKKPAIPPKKYDIKISTLQKSIIGKTTLKDIEKSGSIIEKKAIDQDSYELSIDSLVKSQPDSIITSGGKVTYERISLPTSKNNPSYKSLSELTTKLGSPEFIIVGSIRYGSLVKTYVYGSKGIAFVGSNANDVTYEIEIFEPITTQKYLETYGKGLSTFKSYE